MNPLLRLRLALDMWQVELSTDGENRKSYKFTIGDVHLCVYEFPRRVHWTIFKNHGESIVIDARCNSVKEAKRLIVKYAEVYGYV